MLNKLIRFCLLALSFLGMAVFAQAADFWLEDFIGGTQGQLPTGWLDDSTNPGFNARIAYTSTGGTYATVTVVAGTYGKALSPVQILDTTQYPKLEVKVVGVDAASALQIYIQEQTGAYRHWGVDHDQYITGPGTFTFDLPTITGVSGPLTFSVETTVSGSLGSHAQIDSLRIYSVSTPTFTPTLTPTPTVTNSATATPTLTVSATASASATYSATTNPAFTATFTPTVSATRTISATSTVSSTATSTPTFTSTVTLTSTPTPSSFAYFEDFTSGAPGTQPTDWFDASNGVGPAAEIVISNTPATTSYADVTVTNSASGYGSVTNLTHTINVTQFPYLNVTIAQLHGSTVVFTIFDNTNPLAPVAHPLTPAHIGVPGTYTFNIPNLTGLSGAVPIFLQISVEATQWNWAKFDLIDISSVAAPTATVTPSSTTTPTPNAGTPTFTATPTSAATQVSNSFFDDFTNGLPPVIPPGWRDQTTDPGFDATLQRSGTSLAVMAKVNTATGFGKVLSPLLTTDFNAFQELEVSVTNMDPNTQFILGIQDTNTATGYVQLGGLITAPGLYTRNIPAANNSLNGVHTYNVDLRIQNFTSNSVTLDFVRVGITSTPTITPTSTATPVPNTFRPSANLFIPKQAPLKINYTVQQPTRFRVTVFNLAGQVVRSLVNEDVKGTISGVLEWDGKNDNGAAAASGVYVIRLETDVYRQNIRVAVVR
jgi:hypothetical protein